MLNPTPSQADTFIRELAMETLAEPDFAFRAALGRDPLIAADLAAEVAAKTLAAARPKLLQSKAHILFEAVAVSSRQAIADSIGAVYGAAAQSALESDGAAMASLPERSQSSLSAWRFPDSSLVLCSRSADDSFEASATALARCSAFLEAVGPKKASQFSRAQRGGWGAQGAFPLSSPALAALLRGMGGADGLWTRGVRVSDSQGKDIALEHLLALALTQPSSKSSLDDALAAVLAEKNFQEAASKPLFGAP